MKPPSRATWYVAAAWFIVLGGYACVAIWLPAGATRTEAANVLLCVMPILVNGALLINSVTPDWRNKTFWMLLAFGCTLWMAGQTIWTYTEVYRHQRISVLFNGAIFFFLHTVPLIAALTIQPP